MTGAFVHPVFWQTVACLVSLPAVPV